MAEQLLKIREVCQCFGICRKTFYVNVDAYKADGLQEVSVQGGRRLFSKQSVDYLLARAKESGHTIGQLNLHRRGRPKKVEV